MAHQYKRRLIPIVDRAFQFKYTGIILLVAAVTSTVLGFFLLKAYREMNEVIQLAGMAPEIGEKLDADDTRRVGTLVPCVRANSPTIELCCDFHGSFRLSFGNSSASSAGWTVGATTLSQKSFTVFWKITSSSESLKSMIDVLWMGPAGASPSRRSALPFVDS